MMNSSFVIGARTLVTYGVTLTLDKVPAGAKPGQTVSVTVLRKGKGKRETVRVRLTERPLNPTR